MKKLMTYPVGIVLKAYMAYAFVLIERERRRAMREERAMKKTLLHSAIGK